MKRKLTALTAATAAAAAVSSCGGGDGSGSASNPPPPPPGGTAYVSTATILEQARTTSETAAPYPVNDGALVFTDTSDSAPPSQVDAGS
jgi:hypothetical protein